VGGKLPGKCGMVVAKTGGKRQIESATVVQTFAATTLAHRATLPPLLNTIPPTPKFRLACKCCKSFYDLPNYKRGKGFSSGGVPKKK